MGWQALKGKCQDPSRMHFFFVTKKVTATYFFREMLAWGQRYAAPPTVGSQ